MFSPFPAEFQSSPELTSLYKIALLPSSLPHVQDYFQKVASILSDYFPVTYSALILHDPQKDYFSVEALYGLGKEIHPAGCCRKGTMAKVFESRKPMALQNLSQEPLYEEMSRGPKRIEKMQPPILCVPLVAEDEPFGVININSLYRIQNEFAKDFFYLSILSAILSPAVRSYQEKREGSLAKQGKQKAKSIPLEDLLGERLAEVLNKIDPYVESKARMGLLDDIVAVVEKILIRSALEKVDHVQVAAAQLLGINRNTLRKKIKDLKIKTR